MQRTPNDSVNRTDQTYTSDPSPEPVYSAEEYRNRQFRKASSLRSGSTGTQQQARPSSQAPYSAARSSANKPAQAVRRSKTTGSRTPDSRTRSSRTRMAANHASGRTVPAKKSLFSGSRKAPAQTARPRNDYRRPETNRRMPVKRKRKSSFKKGLLVYSAILLVVLIVGLLIFNSFIANYEKNQPVNIAKNVAEQLSDNPESFLNDHSDMIASMSDTDEVIAKYTDMVSGKQISYIENSNSRAEAPAFDLRIDGANVGTITLEPDGKGSFGLSKWKLASLDIAQYLPDTYAYTILAPSGYTVSINGTPLTDSNITAKDETPEILANAAQFIKEVPKYDSYTAAGLLSIPTVTAADASGKDVGVAAAQEYFVAGGVPDKDFIAEQKDFVESALKSWAYHFINYSQGTNLANYVQSGSDLYAYIFGSDTMDPIYTAFYDWEYITNVEFTEFEAKNYIKYADDCYSVDVKYKLKVDFSNANLSDDGQMLDATWVIVHNKGYWGIADVIYHQGGENSLAESASQSSEEETTVASEETDEETTNEESTED